MTADISGGIERQGGQGRALGRLPYEEDGTGMLHTGSKAAAHRAHGGDKQQKQWP